MSTPPATTPMKLHRQSDVVVTAGGSTTSAGVHFPPRYNAVEFAVQRVLGSSAYDVEVQALPDYPDTSEMYGASTVLSGAVDDDWITVMTEAGIDPDHDFTTQASNYGYYRATISSAGNVTVRLYSIGII